MKTEKAVKTPERKSSTIVSIDSESQANSILDVLHEEHKNISPVLCLALLFVFISADTNWFLMALFQIGLQTIFFSKRILKCTVGRNVLFFFSLLLMTASILSMSIIPIPDLSAPIIQQVFIYFFLVCAFTGFVLTNIYNIHMIFIFSRNVKWLFQSENEAQREGNVE